MTESITQFDQIIARIKQMIEKLDIPSAAFADKANIQRSTLSQILSGKTNPSLEILNRIYEAFPEWDRNWLFFGETISSGQKNDFSGSLFSSDSFAINDQEVRREDTEQEFSSRNYSLITPEQISSIVEEALKCSKEKEQKRIEEIKIFYTDGSFESFVRKE